MFEDQERQQPKLENSSITKIHSKVNKTEVVGMLQSRLSEVEQSLEESQKVLMKANVAIIKLNDKAEITFCNLAAMDMFGYQAQEIRGINIRQFVPEKYSNVKNLFIGKKSNLDKSRRVNIEHDLEVIKADSSTFWINLLVVESICGDSINHTLFIKEIYDQKKIAKDAAQLHRELKILNTEQSNNLERMNAMIIERDEQAEQLSKVNNQMEKFLYSTSHDLRSPISTIMGLVNLMRLEIKDQKVNDYVSKIESSATKLDNTIQNIISYSKSTYQRLKSERVCFEPIIFQIIDSHRKKPDFHNIKIDVSVTGNSIFFTDAVRLSTIIEKIIDNAIVFYDPNKSMPFIRINANVAHDKMILEVADNGIGIGKSYLNDIFSMFFKASQSSKGAGLGLFLVKEATAKLNGQIEVESDIGFGTVFRVTIPNSPKGKLMNKKASLMRSDKKD